MDIKELYENEKNNGKGSEIRDEYHSMSELYFNRLVLFSVLCNQNPDISWKSKKHEDGTMIPDFFYSRNFYSRRRLLLSLSAKILGFVQHKRIRKISSLRWTHFIRYWKVI